LRQLQIQAIDDKQNAKAKKRRSMEGAKEGLALKTFRDSIQHLDDD